MAMIDRAWGRIVVVRARLKLMRARLAAARGACDSRRRPGDGPAPVEPLVRLTPIWPNAPSVAGPRERHRTA